MVYKEKCEISFLLPEHHRLDLEWTDSHLEWRCRIGSHTHRCCKEMKSAWLRWSSSSNPALRQCTRAQSN